MVRYHNFDIVFAEIPGETTLAFNITNLPQPLPGVPQPPPDRGRRACAQRCGTAGPAGLLRTFGHLRLVHGRRRRAAGDRPAGWRGAEELPGAAHGMVFGARRTAEGPRHPGVRLHQAGRLDRGAGAADSADDQPAALQGRGRRAEWRTSRTDSAASPDTPTEHSICGTRRFRD